MRKFSLHIGVNRAKIYQLSEICWTRSPKFMLITDVLWEFTVAGKALDFIFRTFHAPIFHKFSRFPIVSLIFTICCYSVRYVLLIESKSLLMLNFSCDLIYARFQDENLNQSLLHCLRIHRFVPRISSRIPYCAKIYARRRNVSHWNLMRLKYFSSS